MPSPPSAVTLNCSRNWASDTPSRSHGSDGEALAAAAGAGRVWILEDEAGCEIVLAPVHRRADEIQDRRAVDVECAARRLDLLIERLLFADIIDRVSEARTAAARRRKLDPDRSFRSSAHEVGDALLGARCEDDRRRTG